MGRQLSRISFYGICVGCLFLAVLVASIAYLFLGVPFILVPLLTLPTLMAVIIAVLDFKFAQPTG